MLANVVPITPPDAAPEPDFEMFWTIYCRHEAKKDGAKAWNALSASDKVDCLIGALRWRKDYLSRDRHQVPLPGSFIRGERFYDELPAPVNGSVLDTFKPLPAKDRRGIPPEVLAELQRLRGKL